jgi:hypothetical protein
MTPEEVNWYVQDVLELIDDINKKKDIPEKFFDNSEVAAFAIEISENFEQNEYGEWSDKRQNLA